MCAGKALKESEKEPLFRLFFLKDDQDQTVEVEEVEEIDFEEIERHLQRRESVFIALRTGQESDTSSVAREDTKKPWYFTRI